LGDAPAGGKLVLPIGKLVEFEVTSKDVNHNFAIYIRQESWSLKFNPCPIIPTACFTFMLCQGIITSSVSSIAVLPIMR
jgi:hypothetical protein